MALTPFMFNDPAGRLWSDPFFGESLSGGTMMPTMGTLGTSMFQPSMSSLTPMLQAQRREMTPFKNILRADLIETTDGYEVHCDLPGCDPSDLDIQIVDDTLVIKAERSHVHSKDTDTVHTMERSFGQVSRTIKLPKDTNLDDVRTDFNFGVLNVAFGKKAGMSVGRKLQIN